MRKAYSFLTASTYALLLVACNTTLPVTHTSKALPANPTPTSFERQPIPVQPIANGIFSGLLNPADIITITVNDAEGLQAISGTSPGNNGPFELSLASLAEAEIYVIVVEAEGYSVEPASYTIQIEGGTIYIVEDGQRGDALQTLDFHFIPIATAYPPPS